jgi:predicted aldo/keto reductase-like oxidoreductase
MIKELQKYLSLTSQSEQQQEIADHIANLHMRLGINHVNTEDNYHAEKCLNLSLEQLKKNEMKNITQLLDIYNHFGILWVARYESNYRSFFLNQTK